MKKYISIFYIVLLLIFSIACRNDNIRNTEKNIVVQEKLKIDNFNKLDDSSQKVLKKDESNKNDFIFPNSHKKKLTELEIIELNPIMLGLARNEIFARKGYIFKTSKYRNYFVQKSWYEPREDFKMDDLNKVEKYNVNFIKFYEDKSKSIYDRKKSEHKYEVFNKNKKILIDINGDEIKESIYYERNDGGYRLFINNTSVEGKGGNYSDFFAVVDINKTDKFKEIIISDYGPSDDYLSVYYYFDGKDIIKMGETEGLFEYGIDIDGSGKFSAMARADILQTWFFDRYYKLSEEHKINEIHQDIYSTNYDVFIKQPIKLLKKIDDKNDYFILNEGQKARIVGTDNKEWCLIETSTGKRGWFAIDNYWIIRDVNLEAPKVFSGLCYAD